MNHLLTMLSSDESCVGFSLRAFCGLRRSAGGGKHEEKLDISCLTKNRFASADGVGVLPKGHFNQGFPGLIRTGFRSRRRINLPFHQRLKNLVSEA